MPRPSNNRTTLHEADETDRMPNTAVEVMMQGWSDLSREMLEFNKVMAQAQLRLFVDMMRTISSALSDR